MTSSVTKSMIAAAKKSGGVVTKINGAEPASKPKQATKPTKPPESDELKSLRAEISKLKADIESAHKSADRRVQELSAIVTALSDTKPVRVKPVRDMDPKSKTYLLVSHYDFIPVSYRKLDS